MAKSVTAITMNLWPNYNLPNGPLKLVLELEGKKVTGCRPIIGYIHRGLEKIAENRLYQQYLSVIGRVEPVSAFFFAQGFCSAVENIMKIELPIRAQYIRVLTMELNRIASHLAWLGIFMVNLGANSPVYYTFNEREKILSLFEQLTGSRMMHNYYIFGGVRHDISDDILKDTREFLEFFLKMMNEYDKTITNNPLFQSRTTGVGIIDPEIALDYAITGVNIRASGIELDFRKHMPYLVYGKLDFEIPTLPESDSYSRYLLRMKEMRISANLCFQAVDWLENNKDKKINHGLVPTFANLDAGETMSYVETPRGLMICYLRSKGGEKPDRVKWRTASFFTVGLLPELLKGHLISDVMTIFGSLDIALPEVDR